MSSRTARAIQRSPFSKQNKEITVSADVCVCMSACLCLYSCIYVATIKDKRDHIFENEQRGVYERL